MRLRRPSGTELRLGETAPDQVVASIVALHDWYERRARWHRRWFRLSGVATISLSAALPLLAGLHFQGKDTLIGSVGVTIAVVAGLRNFYKWDHLWGVLRRSAFELAFLIDRWRLETAMLEGLASENATPRLEAITARLLADANAVRERESTNYFASLEFPSAARK